MKGGEWERECNEEIVFQIKCQEDRNVESCSGCVTPKSP